MASESDKLRREARDLIASLRKVTPVLLMEAARLVELRAEDQSIAPTHIAGLFEQLRLLGWDGVPREREEPERPWHVIFGCKKCGDVVCSDSFPTERIARTLAARPFTFHSDYLLEDEPHCRGLLEVLSLGR
jgi:hypothetical protein